jgi:hypothetical protein
MAILNPCFYVERSIDAGVTWELVAIVPRDGSGSYSYQDGGLLPATSYQYRVQAQGGGYSSYSATDTESTEGLYPPPTGMGESTLRVVVGLDADLSYTEAMFIPLRYAADATSELVSLEFSENTHGCEAAIFELETDRINALKWLDRKTHQTQIISRFGQVVWQGPVDSVGVTDNGVSVNSLGAFALLNNAYEAAFFSTKKTENFLLIQETFAPASNNKPELFVTNNQSQLYLSTKKNTVYYGAYARWGMMPPAGYTSEWVEFVSFDYDVQMLTTDGGYGTVKLSSQQRAGDGNWATQTLHWTLTGDGTNQTGTVSVQFSTGTREGLVFEYHPADSLTAYTTETGTEYMKITNLRVRGTGVSTSPISYPVNTMINRLFGGGPTYESLGYENVYMTNMPTDDVEEYIIDWELKGNVARYLSDTYNLEFAIWADRTLVVWPNGEFSHVWYADPNSVTLENDSEGEYSHVFPIFNVSDEATHIAVSTTGYNTTDPFWSVARTNDERYSRYRAALLDTQLSDRYDALTAGETWLEANDTNAPRASVKINFVRYASGGVAPAHEVRPNDFVVIRGVDNLLSGSSDSTLIYKIGRKIFNGMTGNVDIELINVMPKLSSVIPSVTPAKRS